MSLRRRGPVADVEQARVSAHSAPRRTIFIPVYSFGLCDAVTATLRRRGRGRRPRNRPSRCRRDRGRGRRHRLPSPLGSGAAAIEGDETACPARRRSAGARTATHVRAADRVRASSSSSVGWIPRTSYALKTFGSSTAGLYPRTVPSITRRASRTRTRSRPRTRRRRRDRTGRLARRSGPRAPAVRPLWPGTVSARPAEEKPQEREFSPLRSFLHLKGGA